MDERVEAWRTQCESTRVGAGRERIGHGQSDIGTCALNHRVTFLGKSAAQIIISEFGFMMTSHVSARSADELLIFCNRRACSG